MPTSKFPLTGRVSNVSRIGLRILDLDARTITLKNRTNNSTYALTPEGFERWRKYFMTFNRYTRET